MKDEFDDSTVKIMSIFLIRKKNNEIGIYTILIRKNVLFIIIKFEKKNRSQLVYLIFGVATSSLLDVCNAARHAPHGVFAEGRSPPKTFPDFPGVSFKSSRRPLVCVPPLVDHAPPQIFNGVQIRRACRPEQAFDFWMLPKPGLSSPALVDGAIVLNQ